MNSYERVNSTLHREPVDRIAYVVTPWQSAIDKWKEQGHIQKDEDVAEHFGCDLQVSWTLISTIDLDHKPVVLEENENTQLVLDGNGARLRWYKGREGTPEHTGFTVVDRRSWEEFARGRLIKEDKRRLALDVYIQEKQKAAKTNRFFCWAGIGPFEQMHPVCGHEVLLMGMALDPDWIKDMVNTYVDMNIKHLDMMFSEGGRPDGIFCFEDMGFKGKPFMSPAMYKDIIQPGHKKMFDYFHSIGCKIIVHSCGFVEPLVPGLIEAGMDCLQAMEVKAGMDMPRLFDLYGDKIAFFGNIDVRTLISNDKEQIDKELIQKIPPVVGKGGSYILHTDHSEPAEVEYETMWYFINKGLEVSENCRVK